MLHLSTLLELKFHSEKLLKQFSVKFLLVLYHILIDKDYRT